MSWRISKYNGPHTCIAVNVSQDHVNLDAAFIATRLINILSTDPSTKIKTLQVMISELTNGYKPSYSKTWNAKQKVISQIHGDWDLSHSKLPQYLQALEASNPGTQHAIIHTESGIPGCGTFDRMFWAFGPAIEGFKHCRPVISVDGTFLIGRYKGVLLIAVSQDPENQIFPVAFAIVEKENKDNWGWFLDCFRHLVSFRQGLCLISDRHAGLMSYLQDEGSYYWREPYAYHRFCCRHLGLNFHKKHSKVVGDEVKVCAMQQQRRKFHASLERLEKFQAGAITTELEEIDRKQWTLAYDGGKRYGTTTTNCSESLNGVLKDARHLPIMATVMCTFYKSVEFFATRLHAANQRKEAGLPFNDKATKMYNHWNAKAVGHRVTIFNWAEGIYEVQTPLNRTNPHKGNHKHTVNLVRGKCTCNKPKIWKIPCSHIIAVCNFMRTSALNQINPYWSVDTSIAMYGSLSFQPLPDEPYWQPHYGIRTLPNTDRLRGKGRPRVNRFRNEMDDFIESQTTAAG